MKKRFFATLILVIMVFSSTAVFADGLTTNTAVFLPQDKISEDLRDAVASADPNEYIQIRVWLYQMDDSYVFDQISALYGAELGENDEVDFLTERVQQKLETANALIVQNKATKASSQPEELETASNIISTLRSELMIDVSILDEDIETFLEEGKDLEELIYQSEQNKYLCAWRKARQEVNSIINNAFSNMLSTNKTQNVYLDSLLNFATLECKASYVKVISAMPIVQEVDLYCAETFQMSDADETDVVDEAVNGEISGYPPYHMIRQTYPYQLTGIGVNVGVLEVTGQNDRGADGKYTVNYDTTNPHLANKGNRITTIIDPAISESMISTTPDPHATSVLAILCGDTASTSGGTYYRGVASGANVFYQNIYGVNVEELYVYSALKYMITECNVSVINMSTGSEEVETYNELDRYIDCLIQQYKVSIVVAAGNTGYCITHPAMAYNAITVGNVTCKTNDSGYYEVKDSSSFLDYSSCTNKPDIVAFGTNVCMLDSNNEIFAVTGTSFSAPMVTGTVALMLQLQPAFKQRPDKIKAILLNSAGNERINVADTADAVESPSPTQSTEYITAAGIMRNKTGAGILNTSSAIRNTAKGLIWSTAFTSTSSSLITEEMYIPYGTVFKLGLVFEKIDHDIPGPNKPRTELNVEMIDVDTGTIVFSSETNDQSQVNNVKIFDITCKKAGTYVFRVYATSIDANDSEVSINWDHQISHSSVAKATLALTCSCEEVNANTTTVDLTDSSTARMTTCSGYGCIYTLYRDITHYYCHSKAFSKGTINYTMSYQHEYQYNGINVPFTKSIANDVLSVEIQLNDTTLTANAMRAGGGIEYTLIGYIERYLYEIYVFDAEGNLILLYETVVYAEYDNVEHTVWLHD